MLRGQRGPDPIGPFDEGPASSVEVFVRTEALKFRFAAESIGVEVENRQAAAVFVDQYERRAEDCPPIDARRRGDRLHQSRLARCDAPHKATTAPRGRISASVQPRFSVATSSAAPKVNRVGIGGVLISVSVPCHVG